MIQGFREFELDLPAALLSTVTAAFSTMESAPLSTESVASVPNGQGVYQLLLGDEIVYVGKTDSAAGLQQRLSRHAWTIQNRQNLSVENVYFKALRVFVFTAMDIETDLIKFYRGPAATSAISWNDSGFGSNDPGRNRDHTQAKEGGFDALYPLNLDMPLDLPTAGTLLLSAVIRDLRKTVPYTFRVAEKGNHADFVGRHIEIPVGPLTAREVLTLILEKLPTGWQATALAGRVILYKEHVADYPGFIVGRSK